MYIKRRLPYKTPTATLFKMDVPSADAEILSWTGWIENEREMHGMACDAIHCAARFVETCLNVS